MEGRGMEPTQLTVTVFSARHLQSKRKGEVCHASVVFGVGKDYYITETVESNSPEWSQEAHISVVGKAHSVLKFKLRDKEHTIGVATKPISELSAHKNKQWLPLSPHKAKSQDSIAGEILVEYHISESRPANTGDVTSPTSSHASSQEELRPSKPVGIRERLSFHKHASSWAKNRPNDTSPSSSSSQHQLEGRRSGSDYELHTKRTLRSTNSETNIRGDIPLRRKLSVGDIHGSQASPSSSPRRGSLENPLMPQVTGISPREGPVEGGQRVVLRGSNLGESRRDVLRVVVADVDCTESLEYHSPTKLVVITLPRSSPGTGPVLVETTQGGEGLSSIKFTFAGEEVANEPEVTGVSPRESSLAGGQRVVLRGSNLGESRSDVVRVWIADIDCSDSVEYFSPSKLVVTTAPRESEGSGAVLVETVRGGVGVSSLSFTYVQSPLVPPSGGGRAPSLSSPVPSEGNRKRSKQDMELEYQTEIKALKQQVRDLKDDNVQMRNENQCLRQYIDKLLLSIIDSSPSILEIKSSLATSHDDPSHPSNGSFVQ